MNCKKYPAKKQKPKRSVPKVSEKSIDDALNKIARAIVDAQERFEARRFDVGYPERFGY